MIERTVGWRAAVCAAFFAAATLATATARIGQPPAPYRIGGGIVPPRKVKDARPVYPADAQRARIQGMVILEVTIAPDGTVQEARVLRSIPLLDQAAIDAVKQWEYTPTVVNGVAVPIVMTVTVNFAMQPPAGAAPGSPPLVRLMAIGRPGSQTIWEITGDRAAAQPRWDPQTAPPPLAIADAAATASAWLHERNKDIGAFELQSVILTRSHYSPSGFWFYQFDFGVPFGSPLRVVVLLDGSVVEPKTDAPAAAAAEPPIAGPPPQSVYRPGAGVTIPRPLHQVTAEYTDEARRARIQGQVTLEFVVLPDGSVDNPRVVRSLDPGLDANSLKAIRQWVFTPGTKDGQPVPVLVHAEMTFNLK